MHVPRIYVACLAAYNNACLHGVWIDASDDIDDIHDQIQAVLKESPEPDAEEYAIHDYEDFAGYEVGEYEGIETVHQIACFIEEHGALGAQLLNDHDVDEAEKMLEENYRGCFTSLADYARDLIEQTVDIPESIQPYVDYYRMGRDMDLSGDIFTIETARDEVHVFWSR